MEKEVKKVITKRKQEPLKTTGKVNMASLMPLVRVDKNNKKD